MRPSAPVIVYAAVVVTLGTAMIYWAGGWRAIGVALVGAVIGAAYGLAATWRHRRKRRRAE